MDNFYNATVTVYNYLEDTTNLTEVWYPTVLHNVRLLVTKGANVAKTGFDSADNARLHVRLDNSLEKPYKEPKEWKSLPDKSTAFTFHEGDFFVKGDTSSEDATQDEFAAYMKKKYDNCFNVSNVDTYLLIPHIEVGGK